METTSEALVVQPGEAGRASLSDGAFELLSDGGAVSASRLTLATGADGAPPHHHKLSHELFYLLDGTLLFRLGDTDLGRQGRPRRHPARPAARLRSTGG